MIRFLQVDENKNIQILKAGEALTRGAAVTKNYATDAVGKATGTSGIYLADVAPNYDGINSVIAPTDGSFESIASGASVLFVPTYEGERYATTELTIGSLVQGGYLKAAAGKFVAGVTNDICEWVYGGTYSDPTGKTMYIVERVAPKTV